VWTPIGSTFSIEQYDHHVVVVIAHDLELELAPAQHGAVEQDLGDRRGVEPAAGDLLELPERAGDAAALGRRA